MKKRTLKRTPKKDPEPFWVLIVGMPFAIDLSSRDTLDILRDYAIKEINPNILRKL